MKKCFLDVISTFEDHLAPTLEWKSVVAARLCKDATEAKRTKEAAEALSKMKVE